MIRLPWGKKYLLAAAAGLLLLATSGVLWAFIKIPSQQEREIIRLNYNLKGEFTHLAFSNTATEKPQPNPLYFAKTIEIIEATYSYRFLAEKLNGTVEEVEIRAVISSPGLWEKEIVVLPATQKKGDFTVNFSMDVNSLFQLAKDIAAELGVGVPTPDVVIKAIVHTIAQTEKGQIQEQFIQNVRVKTGSATLEFVRPFSQSKRGYFDGLRYEQKGSFNFSVYIRPGTLYNPISMDNITQRSYLPAPNPPAKPLPNPIYFIRATDSIDITYSYGFLTDKPAATVEEEVEIRAIVSNPGLWDKEIVLIPPTRNAGDFSITFPLDINQFLDLAKHIAAEVGGGPPAPEVTLKAIVHVISQTEKGSIREDFTQNVKIKVGAGVMEFVRPFNQRSRGEAQGVKYEQRGIFSYSIQTKPLTLYNALTMEELKQRSYVPPVAEKQLPNPIYFNRIIDSVNASYRFQFQAEKPLAGVSEEVEISALVGNIEEWRREVVLIPPTPKRGDFSVTFPLDINGLLKMAKEIATEIGLEVPAPEITLRAIVRTVIPTEKGQIKEEFIQNTKLRNGATTLELRRPFTQWEKGESLGLKYEQKGSFNYEINLKENKLFGKTALRPELEPENHPWWENINPNGKPQLTQFLRPESEPMPALWWDVINVPLRKFNTEPDSKLIPAPVKVAPNYAVETLDHIDLTFTFEMFNDRPVTNESIDVGVSAYLSAPGVPIQSFILVPKSPVKGKSTTITIPLDTGLFYSVIEAVEKSNSSTTPPAFYSLLVRAEVKGNAQSNFGPIQDVLQHDLSIRLDKKLVQLPETKPAIKSGIIKEKSLVPNPRAKVFRLGSTGILGVVVLFILYGVWSYRRGGFKSNTGIYAEVQRLKNKYKDIMVEVESLPPMGEGEKIVKLGSLDELLKTADALLKPVLHEAGTGKHIYCVTDNNTRYVYSVETEINKQM